MIYDSKELKLILNYDSIENAMIKNVDIFTEYGSLTSFVNVVYNECFHQGYGGYRLNGEYASKWILGLLEVTNKTNLKDLQNCPVRIVICKGIIKAIGNFMEDKWYYHE